MVNEISGWWFGTWLLWLSIYWECHHPNWRSHIFQTGRAQPPTSEAHDCMKPESCDDGFANYHFLKRWWSYFRTVLNSLPLQIQPALLLVQQERGPTKWRKSQSVEACELFSICPKMMFPKCIYIYVYIYVYIHTHTQIVPLKWCRSG